MSPWLYNKSLRAELLVRTQSFDYHIARDSGLREASVALVVVGMPNGEAAVLLTLRAARLGRHSGQFALPGGRVDAEEALEHAARRELFEELGLQLGAEDLLGRLDDYQTRSGFCISPFVYWGGSQPVLQPSDDEVDSVYHVPLSELDSVAIPRFEAGVDPERPVLYSQFPSVGCSMYSPTAALMYQFREVLLRGEATRVAHFDQPAFAWQ